MNSHGKTNRDIPRTGKTRNAAKGADVLAFGLIPLVVAMLVAGHAAAEDCSSMTSRFDDAVKKGDLATVRDVAQAISVAASCDNTAREAAGRHAALAFFRAAAGQLPPRQIELLNEAVRFGAPWQVLARLGELHYETKNYGEAQDRLAQALTVMNDPQLTVKPPAPATRDSVLRLAAQARMLAAAPQKPPITRSGAPGGLSLAATRGMGVAPAPAPVRFRYNEADFTPQGLHDADFLRDDLAAVGDPPITLVGHTDAKGGDDYNCALAWRRVAALVQHLRKLGYRGDITAYAMGERAPLEVYEPARHTQEEIDQMMRRVEFIDAPDATPPRNACRRPQ